MRRYAAISLLGGIAGLAMLTIAASQNGGDGPTIEQRIGRLEQNLADLDSALRFRTDAAGPPDRINRDFNLERRLAEIERRVQQIDNEVVNLQRQVSDVARAASQAQNDAQMAQQLARDAANRIR